MQGWLRFLPQVYMQYSADENLSHNIAVMKIYNFRLEDALYLTGLNININPFECRVGAGTRHQ